jgi:TPR repeat protein
VKWYRKAADQGYAAAQWSLGLMYRKGEGVEQDIKEAVKWYRKAAEQGFASAQLSLGVRYDFGQGVTEDDVTAYAWYNITAANGHAKSRENKGLIAEDMTHDQIAKAEALVKEMIENNPKLINKNR